MGMSPCVANEECACLSCRIHTLILEWIGENPDTPRGDALNMIGFAVGNIIQSQSATEAEANEQVEELLLGASVGMERTVGHDTARMKQ